MRDRHHAQAGIVLERAASAGAGEGVHPGGARPGALQRRPARPRARASFEALLEVDPASHYGHFALGESLRKPLGREREAWTHLRLACALALRGPRSTVRRWRDSPHPRVPASLDR